MKITKLNFLSKTAREAELIVSDGNHECLVFSQPCHVELHQTLTTPLHAVEVENLVKVTDDNKKEDIIKSNESHFAYYCIAKVVDIDKSILSIGQILIEIEDNIPSWANEGDLLEFKCSRLDIW